MKNYTNEEIVYTGCPGCAYANGQFALPCGKAFENQLFIISQDWELPIKGMMIISPKRHIEALIELSTEEQIQLISLIDNISSVLINNKICENTIVLYDERKGVHFHACVIPKLDWMKKINTDIAGNLKEIFNYAKKTFVTETDFTEIDRVNKLIQNAIKGL